MNELEKIEININNLNDNIYFVIDNINKCVVTENETKQIEQIQIDNLLRIIRNWDEEYPCSSVIDDEKYIINFYIKDKKATFIGNANFPANYYDFKEWISDIYD